MKILKENTVISGLDFSWNEINKTIKNKGLLSIDLELSLRCNLNCVYCYSEAGEKKSNELSTREIFSVIDQASNLGIQKIVIIGGGEPLLHPDYWKIIKKIRKNNLKSITFTNGTLINQNIAKKLYCLNEDLTVKLNSWDNNTQDRLAGGITGTAQKIKRGIELLLSAGYSSAPDSPKLAIETIVCKQNYSEIFKTYKFCRKHNIIPYIEILTIQGLAKKNEKELSISPAKGKRLFQRLQKYDEAEYGITWPLIPPIAGQMCKRMYYSAYIASTGEVQPCAGVDISGGNIRSASLNKIITTSEIFRKTRNIQLNLKPPCVKCKYNNEYKCYGCRGTAYHHNKDLFGADPTCWNIKKNKHI